MEKFLHLYYGLLLRGKIIAKTALQKKRGREKLNKLELELNNLERKNKHNIDCDTTQKTKEMKNQINQIYSLEMEKKLILRKQKYNKTGNKSAKLLAYKLKKEQTDRVIYRIKVPITEQMRRKTQEIHSCSEEYYKNLYSSKTHERNTSADSL